MQKLKIGEKRNQKISNHKNMSEKMFEPKQFDSFDKVPENQKDRFKPAENGGFVYAEALSKEEAETEAEKIQERVEYGEVKKYTETEELIDDEKFFNETKDNGKVEKTIEIPGIGEIKYIEKTIHFPERFVKETDGVKGYIKKTINWDDLYNTIGISKDLIKNNDFSIKKFSEEMRRISVESEGRIGKLPDEIFKENKLITSKKIYNKNKLAKEKITLKNFITLLSGLTNGQFITQTFNHVFNGQWGHSNLWDSFKNEGLIRQDIGKLDSLIKEEAPEFSYNIFDKKTNRLIDVKSFISQLLISKETKNKIINNLELSRLSNLSRHCFNGRLAKHEKNKIIEAIKKRDDVYFASFFGLSVTQRNRIWNDSVSGVLFGFGKNNKSLKNHNERVLALLEKIEKYDDSQSNKLESPLSKNKEHEFSSDSKSCLNAAKMSTGLLHSDDWIYMVGGFWPQHENTNFTNTGHLHVPIIHNHPEVSELKWCHADYASIPTKKGLNILEMIT